MSFDPDDYLKPHFLPMEREIGIRIGAPIIDWEIKAQPSQKPTWTEYNEIEVHGFRLHSIDSDSVNIKVSMRWKKFERIPFTNRRFKRAETNCDAVASVHLFVTNDYRIAQNEPKFSGVDCTTSGWGLEQIFDYMASGLTWLVTGGQNSFGIFDMFAGFGALSYNFVSYFRNASIDLSDPIKKKIVLDERVPLINELYRLDDLHVEFFLKDVRYDSKGIWLIFGWKDNLQTAVQQVADRFGLG